MTKEWSAQHPKRAKLSTLDRGTVIIIAYDAEETNIVKTAAVLAHNPHSTLLYTEDKQLMEVSGDVLVRVLKTPIELAIEELL